MCRKMIYYQILTQYFKYIETNGVNKIKILFNVFQCPLLFIVGSSRLHNVFMIKQLENNEELYTQWVTFIVSIMD